MEATFVANRKWRNLSLDSSPREIAHRRRAYVFVYPYDNLPEQRREFVSINTVFWLGVTADLNHRNDTLDQKDKSTKLLPSSKEVQLFIPVLKFITQFAMQNDSTCRAVISLGVLNMVLRIYIIFPMLSSSMREDDDHKLALRDACRSTLYILGQSQNMEVVHTHPACVLWSDCQLQPPGYVVDTPTIFFQDRWAAWRRVESSCVKRRVTVIYRYSLWKSSRNVDMEALIDMVEFTR